MKHTLRDPSPRAFTLLESIAMLAALTIFSLLLAGQLKQAGYIGSGTAATNQQSKSLSADDSPDQQDTSSERSPK
jgi:hypothetical protein